MLSRATELFLDVLFPKRCVGCGREGSFLCARCGLLIETIPPVCFVCEKRRPDGTVCEPCKGETRLRRFVAPLRYQNDLVRDLVHTFKFKGAKDISSTLARFIADSVRFFNITIPAHSILVPIPLHKKRLRERGFNQAEMIANHLSHLLSLPVEKNLLIRKEYRKSQIEMSNREARVENAKGIYQAEKNIPKGTVCILVDDVSTTGATLEEAARVLKKAGAKQVWALVAAR